MEKKGESGQNRRSELGVWMDKIHFLSDAMEATSQPFGVGHPDGRLLICNNAFCELTGYTREELFDNVTWSEVLTSPEWREFEAGKLEELRKTGKPVRYEKAYIRKDGSLVPVELLVHPALDNAGNVLFYYSFVTDITDRKRIEGILREKQEELEVQAEELEAQTEELRSINTELERNIVERERADEALRASQTLLRAVTEGSPDPIFVKDRESRILLANPATLRVWSKSLEEVVGKNDRELYADPAIGEAIITNDCQVLKSGTSQAIEELVETPDGLRTYLSTKTPYRDRNGDIVGILGIAQDITERKRAEETLRESEERYRSLFEHMIDGLAHCKMIYDEDNRPVDFVYIAVNDAFGRLTGLHNVEGKRATELFPGVGELHPELFESYGRVALTGRPEHFEINFKPLSSGLSVAVFSVERGYFTAIFENITERKRGEEALRRSEANLAKSQEMAHIGSWEMDVATGEITRSAESYRIFGISPDEPRIDLLDFLSFIVPGDREIVDNAIKSTAETGRPYTVTYNIRRKDGEIRTLLSHGEAKRDASGSIVGLLGTNQDITDLKQTEDALVVTRNSLAADLAGMSRLQEIGTHLVQQDNMVSLLGEVLDAAIEITDADMGNIQLCKRGELKIVESRGFDRPFLDYFNNVHENEAACGTAMVQGDRVVVEDVTKSPIFMGKPSLDVMLAAGARAVQSTPLLSRSGHLLGMFSTHYRKPHRPGERELLLLDLLARQAADLIERMRADEELIAAKQQAELYLDLMGHDISNMHQIALGQLELAKEIMGEQDSLKAEDVEFIDTPLETLNRCAQLIENVRKLQKMEAGQYKLESMDIGRLLADVVALYSEAKGGSLSIDYTPVQNCYVKANPLLKDVFMNLVDNAVKHSNGSSRIGIKMDEVEGEGWKYYRVAVEDNGPGVPDERKAQIFHRLKRGQTMARGTGLGLYIVKTLVESFHGRVTVEDRVYGDHTKGARFVVLLPMVN